MTPDERSAAEQTVRWIGIVNAPDGLNLRRTPDTQQPPITTLPHETLLHVLDDSGDWLRVIVGDGPDGQQGYVYAAHVLRRIDPLPLEPDPDIGNGTGPEAEDAFAAPAGQRIELGPDAGSTERLVAGVWNRFGAALLAEAQRVQIDPGLAAALLAAESNGHGFGGDGRLLIRFENHIFYHYWGQYHQAQYFAHFTFNTDASWRGHRWRPDPAGPWQECHLDDQAVEWQVFSFARQLDETAAMLSISMGIAQIMGFNYEAVGFASVQAMFGAYAASIANQIAAFFRFVESKGLVEAARSGDYHAFARGYNGPGQADAYAAKLHGYAATLAALRQPLPAAPAAVPAPQPGALPAPLPLPTPEEEAQGRRYWWSIGATVLALLLVAAALYRAGWRVVRVHEQQTHMSKSRGLN